MINIETYEATETFAIDSQESQEVKRLAAKLNLPKQQALLDKDGDGEQLPYRQIRPEENAVFGTLFPLHANIEDYDEYIPPRVLAIIADLQERYPLLEVYEVWYSRTYNDPVLIARTKRYGGDVYLIARWGEALDSFETLRRKARTVLTARAKKFYRDTAARVKAAAECQDEQIELYLQGDANDWKPQYYDLLGAS